MAAEVLVAPTPFGVGETESFKLTNATPVIKQYKSVRRSQQVRGVLGYIPRIMVSSDSRHARLITVGLDTLAEAEKRATPIEFGRMLYPELVKEDETEWDIDIWSKFLPTKSTLQQFAYDSIPDQSLRDIEEAQRMDIFDRIEIWSPEGNDLKSKIERHESERAIQREILAQSRDPLAVGVITDHKGTELLFAITRWGESLMPFEAIKEYVATVERQFKNYLNRQKAWSIAGWAFLGLIAVAVIIGVISLFIAYPMAMIPLLFVGGFIGFIGFLFWMLEY